MNQKSQTYFRWNPHPNNNLFCLLLGEEYDYMGSIVGVRSYINDQFIFIEALKETYKLNISKYNEELLF